MQVEEWGDSLAVRLPKALVETLGLEAGDEVELTPLPGGAIGIAKRDPGAEFLKAMEQFRFPVPEGYKFDRVKANVLFFDKQPPSDEPATQALWIYDLRTNKRFTLKERPMTRVDLDDFVACYRSGRAHERAETERFHNSRSTS